MANKEGHGKGDDVQELEEREDMNKRLDEVVAMQKTISENIAVMQERVVERGMQRLDLGKEEEMSLQSEWIKANTATNDKTCYRCGGRGHFARVCPSEPEGNYNPFSDGGQGYQGRRGGGAVRRGGYGRGRGGYGRGRGGYGRGQGGINIYYNY
ncbi:uncharacterized protein LOC144909420 [Branchiostoma floridae x Branchiostoma belcheri]